MKPYIPVPIAPPMGWCRHCGKEVKICSLFGRTFFECLTGHRSLKFVNNSNEAEKLRATWKTFQRYDA